MSTGSSAAAAGGAQLVAWHELFLQHFQTYAKSSILWFNTGWEHAACFWPALEHAFELLLEQSTPH
jgi:hypothetical protein